MHRTDISTNSDRHHCPYKEIYHIHDEALQLKEFPYLLLPMANQPTESLGGTMPTLALTFVASAKTNYYA